MTHILTIVVFGLMLYFLLRIVLGMFSAVLGSYGPILIGCLILAWAIVTAHPEYTEDRASDYRAAQDAVARATGRPCDYACKVMIADLSRRPVEN